MNNNSVRDIFVSSNYNGDCNGSEEAPFNTVTKALELAGPGSRIILKEGLYSESLSIQTSGTISEPIKIEAKKGENVEITSPWFIYDSSDIIISSIKFKDISSQALSIIGTCERNSFNNLSFENCGTDSKTPCTLFIGGSGSNCNVIEKCSFLNESTSKVIGIIISEGNSDEEAKPNCNIIIRENSFKGFDTALIVGTREEEEINGLYGHIIEGNIITDCINEGIRLRGGDISIKDNIIKKCGKFGITIKSGTEQTISFNRFDECKTAISIESDDILIRQNIFINSESNTIEINRVKSSSRGSVAINHNTFVQPSESKGVCIFLSETRPLIARKNLLFNSSNIINEEMINKTSFLEKNYCDIESSDNNLCPFLQFEGSDLINDNYSTETGFGAAGWQVEGEDIPRSEKIVVKSPLEGENVVDELINEVDSKELYSRSFFINQEDNEDDEPPEEEDDGDITDYSTWD